MRGWVKVLLIVLGLIILFSLILWLLVVLSGDSAIYPTTGVICNEDYYNCDDFASFDEAKELYDTCLESFGDIHKLDGDGNGIPCESLK